MIKLRPLRKVELFLLAVWGIIILSVAAVMTAQQVRSRFLSIDEEIELTEEKLLRLNAIMQQRQAIEREYEALFADFKPVTSTDSLLQQMQAIAKRIGVNILNVVPQQARLEAASRVFPIKVESQDDIALVLKFLYSLTEELKSIGVDQVRIDAKERDEFPRVSLQLKAVVF